MNELQTMVELYGVTLCQVPILQTAPMPVGERMKLMIDLFSGLGGASEAFTHGPNPWAVLRYENNPLLTDIPYTTLCDLTKFEIHIRHTVDFIWASPPCDQFSLAYAAPGPTAQREGRVFKPSLKLVERAIQIIEEKQPTYWCIENVMGSINHLEPLLGTPRQIIGPFVFWGNFPLVDEDRFSTYRKGDDGAWSTDPLRKNKRGKIPIEISTAFRTVLDSQKTLDNY